MDSVDRNLKNLKTKKHDKEVLTLGVDLFHGDGYNDKRIADEVRRRREVAERNDVKEKQERSSSRIRRNSSSC
ncbi:hypothetical protein CSUI_007402 [Cystoisospora suis]|uniref:Uncharacterized protein n=1 Tax=Cystoisospora suis TaxID=483139 RepID=A0A2C6KR19_9APIC|nr:hypothetical protein CSUI_007402 [Cystoisospora suis]